MLNLLQLLISISIIYCMAYVEYKVVKIYYTPYILIAFPYSIIFIVQYYSIQLYDLTEFDARYFPIILIHLSIIWVVDMFFWCRIVKGRFFSIAVMNSTIDFESDNKVQLVIKENRRAANIISFVGTLSALYLLLVFFMKAKSLAVIGQVVQEDFQNSYSGGFNFYLRLICMVASGYFFSFFDKRKKKYLLLGLLCLLPNILTFVKGIIFICIVAGVLGNAIVHNRKISIKMLILIGFAGVTVFFGVYLIEICIWQPEKLFQQETYEYIFAKLNFYLISGVQGLNERLSMQSDFVNSGENPVFAFAMNFISKTGIIKRVDTVSNIWTVLGDITNYGVARTNTYSFIGILVLYLGFLPSILFEFILSFMMSLFFTIMIHTKRLEFFINYILFVSTFILAWFDYYLMQTFWIYLFVILLVLSVISKYSKVRFSIGSKVRYKWKLSIRKQS